MTGAMQSSGPAHPDLWSLVTGAAWIDPEALLDAIERQCREPALDFRTRLLVRDALSALRNRWGADRLDGRLSREAQSRVRELAEKDLGRIGFPTLEARMQDPTRAETILEFLRELGTRVHVPARLELGGSGALILAGLLSRRTEDIDAVDEVPAPLRSEHELLQQLADRYGIRLAHFQSHYLPTGWRERIRSLGRFGTLDVFLVDPVDIFVGKLFSKRDKDLDDLRALKPLTDKAAISHRLTSAGTALLADPALRADAERNWYVLYGEALPK
jgi:hypothetical protein